MEAINSPHAQIASGNAKFANKFYDILSQMEENADKNIFFSPLSAHIILALIYQGASGKTAEELSKTLCLPDADAVAEGYHSMLKLLDNLIKVKLYVANKVFVKNNFPLKEKFAKTALESFMSEAQLLDFTNGSECASVINKWVEEKTEYNITLAVDKKQFTDETRLVLVNAIYFKGNWGYPFSNFFTRVAPFYISKAKTMNCSMMHMQIQINYTLNRDLDAKILELPYNDWNTSMVFILPTKRDGITDLEKKLAKIDLLTITDKLRKKLVKIDLPKFKFKTTMDMQSVLERMGLGVIFDNDNCNLSNISESTEPLAVTKIIQKASIEVDEKGSKATASTCCLMGGSSKPPKYCVFNANHPFIILLQAPNSDAILFYGRVMEPIF